MLTEQQIVAVLQGETVEHYGLTLAWRAVHADLRSSRHYRWPFPGRWAMSNPGDREYTEGDPCPQFEGDGLCLARTWRGSASGDIPAITGLICGYRPEDVLGGTEDKLRVTRAYVFEVIDIPAIIRAGHMAGIDLKYADLRGANLKAADLRYADLAAANLAAANLRDANLWYANLTAANLRGADMEDADMEGAE